MGLRNLALLCLLACLGLSGPAVAAPGARIAVLELHDGAHLEADTLHYLSDLLRGQALKLPRDRFLVMTRENLLELLPPGADLAACEGACEVETGRNLGAHYIVTGEVIRLGGALKINLKLYETRSGRLLAQDHGTAREGAALEQAVEQAGARLLSTLGPLDGGHFGLGVPAEGPTSEAPPLDGLPTPPGGLAALDVELLERLQEVRRLEKTEGVHPDVLAARWGAVARWPGISEAVAAEASRRRAHWQSVAQSRRLRHRQIVQVARAMARDQAKLDRLLALDDDVLPKPKKAALRAEFDGAYAEWRGPIKAARDRADDLAKALGVRWVPLPGGSFEMGSRAAVDEGPVHAVEILPFKVAQSEITVAQYRACVEAGACTEDGLSEGAVCNYSRPDHHDHPINCLSWSQARDFSWWIGGRLPSEAEWEYAARAAGAPVRYPWGDALASCERAVFRDRDRAGCGRGSTQPVCSRGEGRTAQGLCDMAGNVWEWTADVYVGGYEGAPTDGSPRLKGGEDRVARGGAWFRPAADLRTTRRGRFPASERGDGMGVRPVRVF